MTIYSLAFRDPRPPAITVLSSLRSSPGSAGREVTGDTKVYYGLAGRSSCALSWANGSLLCTRDFPFILYDCVVINSVPSWHTFRPNQIKRDRKGVECLLFSFEIFRTFLPDILILLEF